MTAFKRAIFLDRDGVVIEDDHYIGTVERVRLIPGSAEAVAALNRAGWVVVIVTNQAGVARGLFSEADVGTVHDHIAALLRDAGARIDAFHYCPHHPEGEVSGLSIACGCRKPEPGMLRRAASELGLTFDGSWMIGDRVTDLEAGAAVGCRTVLLRTGYGSLVNLAALDRDALKLELVAADLADAVEKLGLARTRIAG